MTKGDRKTQRRQEYSCDGPGLRLHTRAPNNGPSPSEARLLLTLREAGRTPLGQPPAHTGTRIATVPPLVAVSTTALTRRITVTTEACKKGQREEVRKIFNSLEHSTLRFLYVISTLKFKNVKEIHQHNYTKQLCTTPALFARPHLRDFTIQAKYLLLLIKEIE